MTRRERLEERLARREQWAEGREAKVAAVDREREKYRGDVAFNTQPGHIPERARLIAREERAIGDYRMAQHHRGAAAGIAAQLESSIFSDDPDAVESLEAKAATIEAECERMKAVNAAFRKATGDKADRLVWMHRSGIITPKEAGEIADLFRLCPWERQPFPAYALSNARANARRCRERIKDVRARQEREQAAEAAPGGLLIVRHEAENWCNVTFAEKPARAVLDALREAGFGWGGGRWSGYLDKLPACVVELQS